MLLFKGYTVSIWDDEKLWKRTVVDSHTTLQNVLNAAKLYT